MTARRFLFGDPGATLVRKTLWVALVVLWVPVTLVTWLRWFGGGDMGDPSGWLVVGWVLVTWWGVGFARSEFSD